MNFFRKTEQAKPITFASWTR